MKPGKKSEVSIPRGLALFAFFATGVIVGVGTWWAFERGGHDFDVFLAAWRLVLEGRGAEIYTATPDKFLYAPGFAWLLAPLAWFPRNLALAIWCFAKAAIIGFVVREFAARMTGVSRLSALGIGALGVFLVARPVLIDLQYGQVNTMILGAAVWALLTHFDRERATIWDALPWIVLAILSVAKLFPLPLLVVPWFVTRSIGRRRLVFERAGVATGLLLIICAPAVSQGWDGTVQLMMAWRDSILSKGLPTESHNQSFAALLIHFFSATPTHVVFEGPGAHLLGHGWLADETIRWLAAGWTLITSGYLLGLILTGSSKAPLRWIAMVVALLIVPSHLVWKPYFLLALPAAILAVHRAVLDLAARKSVARLLALVVIFAAMNLSGFDVVGGKWGAYLEASSLMLFAHLALVALS